MMNMVAYTPKSWIDPQTNQIVLRPNEKPLIETWRNVKITKGLAFSRRIKEGSIILLSFCAYAALAYYFNDRNEPTSNINNAARAFFIPWLLYIFTAYQRLEKYVFALFMGLFLVYVIYPFLFWRGFISTDGVLFIFYFKRFINPEILDSISGYKDLTQVIVMVFAIIMVIEAILLVLKRLFNKKQVIQVFLSEQNIYLRERSKSMIFSILSTIVLIIIAPFNVYNYRDVLKKIHYLKETKRESKKYDYLRIARGIIPYAKITSSFSWINVFVSIGLIVLGVMSGNPIIPVIGIIWGIFTIRNYVKKYKKVRIKFALDSVVGSWIMVNKATELVFRTLDQNFSELLEQYKD